MSPAPESTDPDPLIAKEGEEPASRKELTPAQLAMLPKLEAKPRPARSETMAVVRSKAISAETA